MSEFKLEGLALPIRCSKELLQSIKEQQKLYQALTKCYREQVRKAVQETEDLILGADKPTVISSRES